MSIIFLVHFILSNQHFSYNSLKYNDILENNETKCIYDSTYSQNIITNNIICIIRCKFESIITTTVGGAISVSLRNSFGENILIDDCKFIKCRSNHGGAIYFNIQKDCLTQIINTLFEINSAHSTLSNSGGAIYITSEIESDFEINNCSFYSNSAYSSESNSTSTSHYNYGGAIFISTKVKCSFTIEKCIFYNNSVYLTFNNYYSSKFTNNGGSIYIISQKKDNSKIYNCSFISNSAEDFGGCIFFNNAQYIIDKCDFINNNINSTKSKKNRQGASIYASESNGTLHESSFINNSVNSRDSSSGGAISFSISNGLFELCNFTNNYIYSKYQYAKDGCGGAIFITLPNAGSYLTAKFSFLKCIFNNNSVYSYDSNANGGAISFSSSFLKTSSTSITLHCSINECYFINNKAKSVNNGAYGGAISFDYIISSLLPSRQTSNCNSYEFINKTIFENNIAYSSKNYACGGAISDFYSSNAIKSYFYSNDVLDQCNFINNTAYSKLYDVFGGAFSHISSSVGTNDFQKGIFNDCIFSNNNAYSISNSSYGGAFSFRKLLYGSFNNCTFYNNTAETFLDIYLYEGDEPSSLGGAIYLENSYLEYDNCFFINNTGYGNATKHISTGKGGAIFSEKSFNKIHNSTFINNTLCNYGLKYDIDCYINGGACYFSNSNATLFECNFIKNKAIIHAYESSSFFSARAYGGAIYLNGKNNQLNCSNCLFENNLISISANHQKEFAGAIYLTNGIIKNCVFNDNTAYNGGDIRYDQNEFSFLYIERCYFNHYNTVDNNQIKSLIHMRVNYNSSNINKFIHNKVILNITTVLFDGKIEENASTKKLLKFSFESNCITPYDGKYLKSDSILIYDANSVEYTQINSVFQSDCDDYIDSMTQSTEIETQTKEIETQTKEIETQTKEIETQPKEIETQTKEIETEKIQTQFLTDISERISENSQILTFTNMEQPTITYIEQTNTESINDTKDDSKSHKKNKIIFISLTSIIVFQTILIIGLILFIVIKRKNEGDLIHHTLLDDNNLTSIF